MKFAFHHRRGVSNTDAALESAGSGRMACARSVASLFHWWKQHSNTQREEGPEAVIVTTESRTKKVIQSTRALIASVIRTKALSAFSLLFLAALILPSQVQAQTGFPISGQAVTPTGTPVYNAQLTVCAYTASGIPCAPQANIYADANLSTQPITQPYATDQYGNFNFWVVRGNSYLIQIKVSSTLVYSYYIGTASTSGGGGGGLTIQTNGVNNLSQTLLNHVNGTGIIVSNPSGGIEQFTCNTTASSGSIGCSFIPLTGTGTPVASCSSSNAGQEYYDLNPANSSPQIYICKAFNSSYVWQALQVGSMVYPGAGVPLSTGTAWGTSFGVQGTDTNVLTSGVISGSLGAILCLDAQAGATTAGCASPPTVTFQHNGSSSGINQTIWNANDTFPAPPTGDLNVTFQHDQATGSWSAYVPASYPPSLQMFVPGVDSTHAFIPFGVCVPTISGVGFGSCNGNSAAGGGVFAGGLFGHVGSAQFAFSGAALPSWLPSGDVLDVSLVSYTDGFGGAQTYGCSGSGSCTAFVYPPVDEPITVPVTGVTGANIGALVATVGTSSSVFCSACASVFTVVQSMNTPQIGLLVHFNTVTPPVSTALNVLFPLLYSNNTLSVSTYYPFGLSTRLTSELPAATPAPNVIPDNSLWITSDNTTSTVGQPCTGDGTEGDGFALCKAVGGKFFLVQAFPASGGGAVYPPAGIPLSTGSAWSTSYSAQGTDTKLLTAGTVSGTGSTLCTDALGGATTSGCTSSAVGGSGTTGYLPIWTASNSLGSSLIDYGVTTASVFTSAAPFAVAATSLSTQINLKYNAGHAPACVSGFAVLAPDTSGNLDLCNGTDSNFPQIWATGAATNGSHFALGGAVVDADGSSLFTLKPSAVTAKDIAPNIISDITWTPTADITEAEAPGNLFLMTQNLDGQSSSPGTGSGAVGIFTTDTSDTTNFGTMISYYTYTKIAGNAPGISAVGGEANTELAGSGAVGTMGGFGGFGLVSGTSEVDNEMVGVAGGVAVTNAATINAASALKADECSSVADLSICSMQGQIRGGAQVTNLSGLEIDAPKIGTTGGTLVTNNAGIWLRIVDDDFNTTATNGWAIRSDSSAPSAFAGPLTANGLTDSAITGVSTNCLYADTAGLIHGTGSACGTAVSININGSSVTSPNFNDTTPVAGANGINVKWGASSSNVSAYVPGDGNTAHFLSGNGTWATPAGAGATSVFCSVNAQTGTTYTLVIGDGVVSGIGCIGTVTMNNASSQTVTVPPHSSVAFTVPDEIEFVQLGAGQTCLTAGVGVTLQTPTSLCARAQYSTIGVRQLSTDTWVVFGDTQ